ncbi:hypothetical protein BKA57DRAFT_152913 [Linnemannia elongata]|nr:hypothetical protein BKA57DRAFT_152913 [Linnemannia elongata]
MLCLLSKDISRKNDRHIVLEVQPYTWQWGGWRKGLSLSTCRIQGGLAGFEPAFLPSFHPLLFFIIILLAFFYSLLFLFRSLLLSSLITPSSPHTHSQLPFLPSFLPVPAVHQQTRAFLAFSPENGLVLSLFVLSLSSVPSVLPSTCACVVFFFSSTTSHNQHSNKQHSTSPFLFFLSCSLFLLAVYPFQHTNKKLIHPFSPFATHTHSHTLSLSFLN